MANFMTENSSAHTSRPRFRWLKRLGWLALWIFTLLVLAVTVENWRGRRAWKAYVAEAEAKGDRLDPEAVLPPPVPDAENLAMAPLFQPLFDYSSSRNPMEPPKWREPAAKEALDRRLNLTGAGTVRPIYGGTWRSGHFVDLAALQAYYRGRSDFPKSPQSQKAGEDVLMALTKFDKEIGELREAGARPQARFPLRYEDGVGMVMPHAVILRNFSQIANLRAVAELALDRMDAASQDTLLSLRTAEAIAEEPILISVLVRVAIVQGAMEPVWEGLARRQWTDEQLAALDAKLAKINFAAHYQSAVRGERNLFSFTTLDSMNADRSKIGLLTALNGQPQYPGIYKLTSLIPAGWFDANKVAAARWYDEMFTCADAVADRFFPDRSLQVEREIEDIVAHHRYRPDYVFIRLLGPALLSVQQSCAAAQGTVNLARMAIALERHRLRRGAFPETLAQLDVGAAPNGLLMDPGSGHLPHYTRAGDGGFTLYYDGWNQLDDGGKVFWKDKEHRYADPARGDLIWPQVEP
jgi:hypothetical protein